MPVEVSESLIRENIWFKRRFCVGLKSNSPVSRSWFEKKIDFEHLSKMTITSHVVWKREKIKETRTSFKDWRNSPEIDVNRVCEMHGNTIASSRRKRSISIEILWRCKPMSVRGRFSQAIRNKRSIFIYTCKHSQGYRLVKGYNT